jgi:hypothetical protein
MAINREELRAAGDRHLVAFYDSDGHLLDSVVAFFHEALAGGEAGVIVATEAHCRLFSTALRSKGLPVERLISDGRLLFLDAEATLATFMGNGAPDRMAFRATIAAVVREATAGTRQVRVYGEMVALLWDGGDTHGAIQLEDLWNEIAADYPFSLLCAYPMRKAIDGGADDFLAVCHQHAGLVPPDGFDAPEEWSASREALLTGGSATRADGGRLDEHVRPAFMDEVVGQARRLLP